MALSETGPVDTAGEGEVGRSERGTDTHTCDGELGGGGAAHRELRPPAADAPGGAPEGGGDTHPYS